MTTNSSSNSNNNRAFNASRFDCGDGVPALSFTDGSVTDESFTGDPSANAGTVGLANRTAPKPATNPRISVRMFAIGASVIAQLIIGLGVALGGNPLVGVVAAVTVMLCALTLVIAEAVKAFEM